MGQTHIRTYIHTYIHTYVRTRTHTGCASGQGLGRTGMVVATRPEGDANRRLIIGSAHLRCNYNGQQTNNAQVIAYHYFIT